MAERSGVRGGLSQHPGNSATEKAPPAPGASASPQMPGMVPDRSTVPGHFSEIVPPVESVQRPLSQFGTAEEILGVFSRIPADRITADDFEQAGASYEEVRKAVLAKLPPVRPAAALSTSDEPPRELPATAATGDPPPS